MKITLRDGYAFTGALTILVHPFLQKVERLILAFVASDVVSFSWNLLMAIVYLALAYTVWELRKP